MGFGFVGLLFVLVQLAVVVFVLVMLFRLTVAVERISELLDRGGLGGPTGDGDGWQLGQRVRFAGRPREREAEDGIRETLSPGREGEVVGRLAGGRLAVRFDGFGVVECDPGELTTA